MENKLNCLETYLKELGSLCIAFSGGVDSTYLLAVAHKILGERVLAVTVTSTMCPQREQKEAIAFAEERGIRHIKIPANEYEVSEFVANEKDRCYYCKKAIFTKIKKIATREGISYVADGSNIDDDRDYRPGMRAIKELEILSPLKLAGLKKEEIRMLSKKDHLATWDKPAMACLASRIPYGKIITAEKLGKIEAVEEYLMDRGFRNVRVRYYEELAKIEVPPEEISKVIEKSSEIIGAFKKIGFTSVAVDLQGYRMGSMNEILEVKRR